MLTNLVVMLTKTRGERGESQREVHKIWRGTTCYVRHSHVGGEKIVR